MKTGGLYIDDNDAFSRYGVFVVKGGWNSLVAFPPLKPIPSNDWHEEDGIDADLSNPVLNTQEVQLRMAIIGTPERFASLIALLSDGAYHTFRSEYINRTYKLRLISQPNMTIAQKLGMATLKLANDFPLDGYQYKIPSSSIIPADDYKFDDRLLSDYGVRILHGSLAEIMKTSNVKSNLTRNIAHLIGVIYDNAPVTFKTKDVKIYCLMRAQSFDEFWQNHNALLFDLTRAGEHRLWVKALNQEFFFHYKSCQVTDFFPDDKIWLEFTLTLTFTHSFRLKTNTTKGIKS